MPTTDTAVSVSVLTDEEIRALEGKVIEALKGAAAYEANCSTTMWDNEMRRTIEAREVVVTVIMPLLRTHRDRYS